MLKRSERCFFVFSPAPGRVLLCEVIKRIRFSREVLDESAVEICEAEESPNIAKVARFRPIGDGGSLAVIHAYTTGLNDHAEVFDVVAIEFALLRL